MLINLLVVQL